MAPYPSMNTPPQQGIPPRRRRDSLHPHARIALLRLALVIAAIGTAVAAQQPSLGFSHDDWTTVLSRFVDERGRVSY